jgi:ribonuclease P protein component
MNSLPENIEEKTSDFSFHKTERLCSKKIIEKLFAEGKSVFVYPVKIVYLETPLPAKINVQAAFTVGKRNFKRAVKRNLLKRRMREAYRLNKQQLYDAVGEKQVAVFFIFTGKEISEYKQIEAAVKKGMKKLIAEFSISKP